MSHVTTFDDLGVLSGTNAHVWPRLETAACKGGSGYEKLSV